MSNRTIIEINHDLWHRIESEPAKFGLEIAEYLRGCSHESRDRLERFGVKTLATVHHSTDVRVSFDKVT